MRRKAGAGDRAVSPDLCFPWRVSRAAPAEASSGQHVALLLLQSADTSEDRRSLPLPQVPATTPSHRSTLSLQFAPSELSLTWLFREVSGNCPPVFEFSTTRIVKRGKVVCKKRLTRCTKSGTLRRRGDPHDGRSRDW